MRPARNDDGAYLVLYALLAVALFTMVAVVLDLAALRQGRRSDRAAVDLAATAAAGVLDPSEPSTFAAACDAAWGYTLENRDDAKGAVSAPDCATSFPQVACDPATPVTTTGTAGPLRISITYPVTDTSVLMAAEVQGGDQPQAVDPAIDGSPCQRVGVRIERDRPFLFGGLAGVDRGHTDVHSVARSVVQPGVVVPTVAAFETTACDALSVTGTSSLQLDPASGGLAIVDSDASTCAGPGATIEAAAGASLDAGATGIIRSFALSGGGFPRAWSGNVLPAPTPALTRTGRGFLDLRYSTALNALQTTIGPGPGAPAGFFPYAGPTCTIDAGVSIVVPSDIFVGCGPLVINGSVTFTGSRAVFSGDVVVNTGGCFAVGDGSCGAAGVASADRILYFRTGRLSLGDGGQLSMTRTFVYAAGGLDLPRGTGNGNGNGNGGGNNGNGNGNNGNGSLSWTAPTAGSFEDLMFWSDAAVNVLIGQQIDSTLLEGTIAAPNGSVTLEAGAGTTQPLQVAARSVHLQGDAAFTLQPTAARATGLTIRQVKLLR